MNTPTVFEGEGTVVALHNIRSAHNVGAIFRTADGAGVQGLILAGYTPTPIDRFGRKRQDIAKVALGSEEIVPYTYCHSTYEALRAYKAHGFEIIGVEQHSRAIPYHTYKSNSKCVFVFGNEVEGLSEEVINICDTIVQIPLHGKKESLNVAVAVGVVLFNFYQ